MWQSMKHPSPPPPAVRGRRRRHPVDCFIVFVMTSGRVSAKQKEARALISAIPDVTPAFEPGSSFF